MKKITPFEAEVLRLMRQQVLASITTAAAVMNMHEAMFDAEQTRSLLSECFALADRNDARAEDFVVEEVLFDEGELS